MSSSSDWPCAALRAAELASRTTLKVGGRAEWLLEPANPEELRVAWLAAHERGLPVRMLGGGANLLIADGELPGVVIGTDRLAYCFRPTSERQAGAELFESLEPDGRIAQEKDADPRLVVWCGEGLPALVRRAAQLGWSGLEHLAGVPGHVGGAIAMNAGGREGWIGDVVESLRILEPDGTELQLERSDWNPGYRDGKLAGKCVVGAVLRLEPVGRLVVEEATREYLKKKNAVQPVTQRSAGCIFKNPDPEQSDGRGAGQLVDQAGAKGLARGGARISERHGNFIVNAGGATAADVWWLIEEARRRVLEATGVELELEVQCWGGQDPEDSRR